MDRKPNTRIILLVEDDAADALLVKRAFGKAGIPTPLVHLKDGDAAVEYLLGEGQYADREVHPVPSLMLLDLKLPRRSGIEVTRWVRERDDGLCRVPIVMLTSSERLSDINEAYDAGVNSYVTKSETTADRVEMLSAVWEYWLGYNQLGDLTRK